MSNDFEVLGNIRIDSGSSDSLLASLKDKLSNFDPLFKSLKSGAMDFAAGLAST